MAKKTMTPEVKKYVRFGIIGAAAVAVVIGGVFLVKSLWTGADATIGESLSGITADATVASELRMAVIRMDAIQMEADALQALRKQRESYEEKLRDELTREQTALEKEKAEIEKSQDVLSREALQRRVVDYQNRVNALQRDLTERAQAIEASFQKALADVQTKHLDPLIAGIIDKKNLSLVIDGRFARIGNGAENLDITNDVIDALNKRISTVKMETPKGM